MSIEMSHINTATDNTCTGYKHDIQHITTAYHCKTQYYALYHLEVAAAAFPELRFSFHVPYPIGKAFLPSPHTLPLVEHAEQDCGFRFGRPLLEDEKLLYQEKVVEANFALALAA